MQTIFITGASSGIGKETAKFFPRNLKKGEDLKNLPNVILMPLDVTNAEQIRSTCAAKRAQQAMVESLYYELKPFNVFVKAMIPGGTKTNFQTPLNDLTGCEKIAANQRKYLLAGNDEFPDASEAAQIIFEAATDGKDQINYPTDSVCKKLYDQYQSMGLEEFKNYFGNLLFEEK